MSAFEQLRNDLNEIAEEVANNEELRREDHNAIVEAIEELREGLDAVVTEFNLLTEFIGDQLDPQIQYQEAGEPITPEELEEHEVNHPIYLNDDGAVNQPGVFDQLAEFEAANSTTVEDYDVARWHDDGGPLHPSERDD